MALDFICETIFPLAGLFVFLRFMIGFSKFFYSYFIRRPTDLFKEYGGEGSWAIVTGASDGIGFGYCNVLAAAGFNIVMIARNMKKLAEKRDEIKKRYPKTDIEIIEFNFINDYSVDSFKGFEERLMNKDIRILVNNVGIGNAHRFEAYPLERIREILRVTLGSFMHMTRFILPMFLSKKSKCAILTISSATGIKPWPYFTIYGSSKSFMNRFMDSLCMEHVDNKNITFMNCVTGEVISGTHPTGSIVSISSEQCAREQLRFLGYQTLTYGHIIHYLSTCVDFELLRSTIAKEMSISYEKLWNEQKAQKA